MAAATRTSKRAIGSIRETATLHVQHTFCTFLCRHFTTTTANSITRRFMEDVNTPRRIFLSPCKLGSGPHEFNYREIKLHLLWPSPSPSPSLLLNLFNVYLACGVLASMFWLASSSGPGDEGKNDDVSSPTSWRS